MAKSSVPVAQKQSSGDLKRVTTQNETYLAYKAGEKMGSGANIGAILDTVTIGGTYDTVGTLTDTFYTDPVGTHSGTTLATGSTTKTLYQKRGEGEYEQGSAFRRPMFESDGSLYEMDAVDFNELGQRLHSIIVTNEYPGANRLSSSSPGAGWSIAISNLFTDTRTDGNSVGYSIYQKTSGTEPAGSNNPVYARKGTYGVGTTDYDGNLQAMTDAQVKETFGRIVAESFSAADNDIGRYVIRSSAQGAPSEDGTWVARGTATDTRNNTELQQYTNQYTGFSEVQYAGERTYSSNEYTGERNFGGTRQFAGSRNYTGQYTSPEGNFGGTRQFAGSRNYTDQYTSSPAQFTGTRQFAGSRNYTGQFMTVDEQNWVDERQFAGTRQFAGSRNYATTYQENVNFVGNRNFTGAGQVYYAGSRISYYTGARAFFYPTSRPGFNPSTPGGVNPGGVNPSTPGGVNPPGSNPPGSNPPTPGGVNPPGTNPGTWVFFSGALGLPFGPVFIPGTPTPGNPYGPSPGNPTPGNPNPGNPYGPTPGNPNPGNPYGPTPGNPVSYSGTGVSYQNQNFGFSWAGQYLGPSNNVTFTGPRTFVGLRGFAGSRNYAGQYTSQPNSFLGERTFTGQRTFAGTRTYTGQYTSTEGQYTGTRQFAGSRNYTDQYTSAEGQFAGTRQFAGSRNYTDQYTSAEIQFVGERQFAGERTYTGQYTGEYTAQYSTQYTGETIISTTQTIETYTLYVKVSE